MNPATPDPESFDVIILADLARHSDCGLRIRRELQTYHEIGYRTGLRHLPDPGKRAAVSPDIQRCVREGLAELVAPDVPVAAGLAVVLSPGLFKGPVAGLSGIRANRVVLMHDRAPDPAQMGSWFSFGFGQMSWAPTNRWVRGKFEELALPEPIEAEDWRSVGLPVVSRRGPAGAGRRPVIGRVSAPGAAQWPKTAAELAATYPTDPSVDFRVMGAPPSDLLKKCKGAAGWSMMSFDEVSVERFVEMLDVFFYFPGANAPELPEAAISTAMASGKIVVLPPRFRPHFGPGAIYAEPDEAMAAVTDLFEDEDALATARQAAVENARLQFSAATHSEKVAALLGPEAQPPKRRRRKRPARRKTALLVPSNGVGLGHVTRLLAVARRLEDDFEPVFATYAQAMSIIESFGYLAEYIPSQGETAASLPAWDNWLRYELGEIVQRHEPEVVVYDGNNPTPGLMGAALSHGRCGLAWVRRAMCPEVPSPFLENARFFDRIIEPGEYAGERDTGPTVVRRHEVDPVPPVRLLDAEELLPKDRAIGELGLSPDRPSALIQLGGSATRDVRDLIDRVVQKLSRLDGLQLVVADWNAGTVLQQQWPGVRLLRGFPISRFFNAFDFSVAAAGYNTYHEVIAFGLPTVFVANRQPSMDDQGARAEYAQDHGVGFDVPEDELHLLPAICEALLNERANALIRRNCSGFDRTNGASEAAGIIAQLGNIE